MKFEKLKKELQDILAHYSQAIGMVDEESNTFLGQFNEELECDGYFKLVELIEKSHNECHLFIYNNVPEDYWQKDEEELIDEECCHNHDKCLADDWQNDEKELYDYVDEDSYGYHQKKTVKNYGCFYDDEDYSHTDINEEIID